MLGILSGLIGLGSQYLENKREKSKAKAQQEVKLIEQTGSWEEIHAKGSAHSWKDEFLTIVLSTPFIVLFVAALFGWTEVITNVEYAFTVLETKVPDKYWYLFGVVVGASFGVRKVSDIIAARNNK